MKIDYTNLSFTQLIDKIEVNRFFDLPRMVREAFRRLLTRIESLETSTEPPYKVYTALLTQSGTDAPVATVLENTLGGTVVWTRSNVGEYLATLTGAFTENKTLLPNIYTLSIDGTLEGTFKYSKIDTNSIQLETRQNLDGSREDDLINAGGEYFTEIRVYN